MLTLMTFRIHHVLFGVEIDQVREIDQNVEYTAVPGAPANIVGLFNMRGHIVVLYHLAAMFGYSREAVRQGSICIVMESGDGHEDNEGFFIDQTGDVISVREDVLEPLPANVKGKEYRYIKNVVKLEKELLLLLDCQKIFSDQKQ